MRVRSGLAAAVLAAAAVLMVAGPASAHNVVVASTPEPDSTLTELPDSFSITTNEALLDVGGGHGFGLQVRDADGAYYGTGCVEVVDATMSTPAALGPAGDYTILYQFVSSDGHPVSGSYTFTWSPPDGFEPSEGVAGPVSCGGEPQTGGGPVDADAGTSGPGNVPLGDVLWIGGAVLAVGAAVVIAIVFATRRAK